MLYRIHHILQVDSLLNDDTTLKSFTMSTRAYREFFQAVTYQISRTIEYPVREGIM